MNDLVYKRLLGKYGNYPPQSISAREIIFTLPCGDDPEEMITRVNRVITMTIYQHMIDSMEIKPTKSSRISFAPIINRLTKPAIDKERSEKLSGSILKAISMIS